VIEVHRTATHRLFHVEVSTEEGGELVATGSHPFWTQRGWVTAEDLSTQDVLADEVGHPVPISAIAVESRDARTFNLSVQGAHTFFVVAGRTAVLVHNVDPSDILYSHPLPQNPTLSHGDWEGMTVDEMAMIARYLGRLPDGIRIEAVRQASDGRWVTLNNRSLMIAQRAELRNVPVVDAGAAGLNKLQRNYTASGIGGPLEDPVISCD
jgi:hypothetical protein